MFTSRTTQLDDLLSLICEELQLSPSMHKLAEQRYHAVGDWLGAEGSPLRAYQPTIYPQGSFRIGTTVHPLKGNEFDLDLVCELNLGPKQASPLNVLRFVEQRLRQHSDYAPMIEIMKRCIRLTYANEFHLDVLPARPKWPPDGTQIFIPDRELLEWLPSNPKGYAAWFESRGKQIEAMLERKVEPLPSREDAEEKTSLQRSVQLVKRWRDIVYEATPDRGPRSIVLTTLAGHTFTGQPSTAVAFGEIIDGIARLAAASPTPLEVYNPSQPKELLSEKWRDDPRIYTTFVARLEQLRRSWGLLQEASDPEVIAAELGVLFGEKVTKEAYRKQAARVEASRKSQTLGVIRSTGALSIGLGSGVAQVRKNTFYGEA